MRLQKVGGSNPSGRAKPASPVSLFFRVSPGSTFPCRKASNSDSPSWKLSEVKS